MAANCVEDFYEKGNKTGTMQRNKQKFTQNSFAMKQKNLLIKYTIIDKQNNQDWTTRN